MRERKGLSKIQNFSIRGKGELLDDISVVLTFRPFKFCKEDSFWKPTSEIPPNPPLVKGGRGDFWRALPHGNLFWLRIRCAVPSVANVFWLRLGRVVIYET
jgi:hypothetical protein